MQNSWSRLSRSSPTSLCSGADVINIYHVSESPGILCKKKKNTHTQRYLLQPHSKSMVQSGGGAELGHWYDLIFLGRTNGQLESTKWFLAAPSLLSLFHSSLWHSIVRWPRIPPWSKPDSGSCSLISSHLQSFGLEFLVSHFLCLRESDLSPRL